MCYCIQIGRIKTKESIEFLWESPEFEFKEKSKYWYWIVGVVALIIIAISLFLGNYLFGFFILVGTFLMFVLSTQKPLSLPVEVSEHGIKIHDKMHPYTEIDSFWIGENKNGEAVLILLTRKPINPRISIIIQPHVNIMQLREYLLNFIEEQELREPFTDKIIDKIGF